MADRITSNRCRMWLRTVNGIPPFIFYTKLFFHDSRHFVILFFLLTARSKARGPWCGWKLDTEDAPFIQGIILMWGIVCRRGPDHAKKEETRFRKVPWSNFPPLLMVFYYRKGNHNLHSLSIKLQPLGTCVRKFQRITTFMWTIWDLYPEVSKNLQYYKKSVLRIRYIILKWDMKLLIPLLKNLPLKK